MATACGNTTMGSPTVPIFPPNPAASLNVSDNMFSAPSKTTYSLAWDAGPSCASYDIVVFAVIGTNLYLIDNVPHTDARSGSGTDAARVSLTPFPGARFMFAIRPRSNNQTGAVGQQCSSWRLALYPAASSPSP
jgi:hypothetical protein